MAGLLTLTKAKKVYGLALEKVYGPYIRRDGRQHVILRFEGGSGKTVSYPKFLMECKLGRVKARSPTAEASVLRTVQVWVRIPPGLPSESSQVRSPPPVALFLSIKRVITLQREDFVRR